MKKKVSLFVFIGAIALSLLLLFLNIEFLNVYNLPNSLPMSYSDVEHLNENKVFGKNISAGLEEKFVNVGGEKLSVKKLVFKLFGLIPIRTIEAKLTDEKEVFLGGAPIGFSIDVDGLIVVGSNSVSTEKGLIDNLEKSDLKIGDIITEVNGKKVTNLEELKEILDAEDYKGEKLNLKVLRKQEYININLKTALDKEDGKYKIGLWVKNDASGVGTLTYVECDTLNYGALGHPITDYETGVVIPAKSGKIYPCSVVGLNKGEKGVPGEIKGVFMQGKSQKGDVEKNSQFGVFGKIKDKDKIVDSNKTADVASRLTMKPGKATLVSSISGMSEEYEIEIIKTNYQPSSSDKSFVFRVTDKRLLDLTGGIIQGMSGSPIMQNGKVVGAVTHVFVSDPTKGYGVYIDWMMSA
ncbi:MAG: SpoIVB peptidase [Firmicutes bacterium]|nr:SpoIVB peptidase [Bacillota bacterium]MDY3659283.1 SpoIVB peptidase [Eubacteriales bacterium]